MPARDRREREKEAHDEGGGFFCESNMSSIKSIILPNSQSIFYFIIGNNIFPYIR